MKLFQNLLRGRVADFEDKKQSTSQIRPDLQAEILSAIENPQEIELDQKTIKEKLLALEGKNKAMNKEMMQMKSKIERCENIVGQF